MSNVLPIVDNAGIQQEMGSSDQVPEDNLNRNRLNRLLALIIFELQQNGIRFQSDEINDQLKYL